MKIRDFFSKVAPFLQQVPPELSAEAGLDLPALMEYDIVSIEVGYSPKPLGKDKMIDITIFPVIDGTKVTLEGIEPTIVEARDGKQGESPNNENKVLSA